MTILEKYDSSIQKKNILKVVINLALFAVQKYYLNLLAKKEHKKIRKFLQSTLITSIV